VPHWGVDMREPLNGVALLLSLSLASSASALTMDWTWIGDAGNAPDTQVMQDGTTGLGSVSYAYRIGTYEITVAQYTEFLNAVAASDPNGLYSGAMNTIERTGVNGSYHYAAAFPYEQVPVYGVTMVNAARFANWMHNGQLTGAQTSATTEGGAYVIDGPNIVGSRSSNATFFIPDEDEWYKAAYYDPTLHGYHDFPTGDGIQCDTLPFGANCDKWNPWVTDVGSYYLSPSPYGTFDQAGNVAEWNEDRLMGTPGFGTSYRLRGGSFDTSVEYTLASARFATEGYLVLDPGEIGFRLASAIPEPSTGLLVVAGLLGFAGWRRVRA